MVSAFLLIRKRGRAGVATGTILHLLAVVTVPEALGELVRHQVLEALGDLARLPGEGAIISIRPGVASGGQGQDALADRQLLKVGHG
jgi:hypothetical protein